MSHGALLLYDIGLIWETLANFFFGAKSPKFHIGLPNNVDSAQPNK